MRKIVLAVLYVAMILIGSAAVAFVFLHGGKFLIAFDGGAIAAAGIYLSWTDFFSSERL